MMILAHALDKNATFYSMIYLFVTVFAVVFVIIKRDYIRENKHVILPFVGILALTQIQRYVLGVLAMEEINWYKWIPYEICRIGALLSLIFGITNYKKLIPFVFVFSMFGFTAVLAPDGDIFELTYGQFIRPKFTYDHLILTVMPFYLIAVEGFRPTFKNLKYALGTFALLLVGAMIINPMVEMDYFYFSSQPVSSDIFGQLSDLPFLGVFLATTVILTSLYLLIGKMMHRGLNLAEFQTSSKGYKKAIVMGILILIIMTVGYFSPLIK